MAPRTEQVAVDGGSLAVHRLTEPSSVPVLAVHGITANGLSWQPFASAVAGRATVWAPDLRGRAASRAVGGPYGLGAHVDDLVRVLDHLGLDRAVVVGHSMGAFVTALLAARHPDRVARAVLVDGGFAFPAPPDQSSDSSSGGVDARLRAVLGPAMQRLSMTFGSFEKYLAFFGQHSALGPALAGPVGDDVRDYLRHDLVEDGPATWRSSCVVDAVRADGADVLLDAEAHAAGAAAAASGVPVTLLWAARGLVDEPQGLYDEQRLAALALPGEVEVVAVPDVNHYTVLFDDHAVGAIRTAALAT